MTKVILFKGKFKIKPPFNDEQLRDINNDYHFDEFDLANDCLTCKGTLREFRGNRGFKDIEYIIKNYKRSNKLKGEVIGMKFDKDRYKFCKFFIKYNKVKDEFLVDGCNITKKGKTRKKREKPQLQTMEAQTAQPTLQTNTSEVVSIAPRANNFRIETNNNVFTKAPRTRTLSASKRRQILGCETDRHEPSLTAKDFYSLNEDKEVTEDVINAYIYINNKKRSDDRKIAIEHPYFMDCIDTKQYDFILKDFANYKNKEVKDYEYIIFPFNRETEWILCIIEMNERIIKIYDSEKYEYNQEVEEINDFLTYAGIGPKFKGEFIDGPHHICGEDNGVHIMEYAKRWLLKEPINFTYEDIPRIRTQMKTELRQYLNNEAKQTLIKKISPHQGNVSDKIPENIYEREMEKILKDPANINCLNDDIGVYNKTIFAYLCLLYQNIPLNKRKNIGITDDSFMDYLLQGKMPYATNNAIGMNGHKFKEYKIFIIPFAIKTTVQVVDSHAVLAIIDNEEHKIKIYDSDNQRKSNVYKDEFAVMHKFIKYQGITSPNYREVIINKPSQNTLTDCGVFTMEYARRILLEKEIKFGQSDIKNIRSRIKQELMTRTIKQ